MRLRGRGRNRSRRSEDGSVSAERMRVEGGALGPPSLKLLRDKRERPTNSKLRHDMRRRQGRRVLTPPIGGWQTID